MGEQDPNNALHWLNRMKINNQELQSLVNGQSKEQSSINTEFGGNQFAEMTRTTVDFVKTVKGSRSLISLKSLSHRFHITYNTSNGQHTAEVCYDKGDDLKTLHFFIALFSRIQHYTSTWQESSVSLTNQILCNLVITYLRAHLSVCKTTDLIKISPEDYETSISFLMQTFEITSPREELALMVTRKLAQARVALTYIAYCFPNQLQQAYGTNSVKSLTKGKAEIIRKIMEDVFMMDKMTHNQITGNDNIFNLVQALVDFTQSNYNSWKSNFLYIYLNKPVLSEQMSAMGARISVYKQFGSDMRALAQVIDTNYYGIQLHCVSTHLRRTAKAFLTIMCDPFKGSGSASRNGEFDDFISNTESLAIKYVCERIASILKVKCSKADQGEADSEVCVSEMNKLVSCESLWVKSSGTYEKSYIPDRPQTAGVLDQAFVVSITAGALELYRRSKSPDSVYNTKGITYSVFLDFNASNVSHFWKFVMSSYSQFLDFFSKRDIPSALAIVKEGWRYRGLLGINTPLKDTFWGQPEIRAAYQEASTLESIPNLTFQQAISANIPLGSNLQMSGVVSVGILAGSNNDITPHVTAFMMTPNKVSAVATLKQNLLGL